MEKPTRDPRLDFFRGAALFVIFVAHTPGTALWHWIPARFGLSDAAHLFVFCSGYAAAIAFGGTFDRYGFCAGSARVALRCAQLYCVHLCLFLALAALAAAEPSPGALEPFFAQPREALLGLATLAWVPPYLDILPLYIVLLAMVPAAMLLAKLHTAAPVAAAAALYAAASTGTLNLAWFFDPFAWQLLFFTGFFLRRGWLEAPGASRALLALALAYVGAAFLVTRPAAYESLAWLGALHDFVHAHTDKTRLDLLAYLHFLATAYLALHLLRGREHVLSARLAKPVFRCGQQALSVFAAGVFLSQVAGIAFDRLGTGLAAQAVVNGAGFAGLFLVAYAAAWFKAPPWKRPAPAPQARTLIAPSPRAAAIGTASAT